MEVRFRTLRDSTLKRDASSGQLPNVGTQNFLEVVESMAGAEQTPGEDHRSVRENQKQPQKKSGPRAFTANDNVGDTANDSTGLFPPGKILPPHTSVVSEDKPLGARIDMTA